ncbi:MAG TPA: class I SAM-dependent methyltransferase [Nitrolancea sp.]|nr:class I SAM-dependent methyltransferase [Nitrolancea sp.]
MAEHVTIQALRELVETIADRRGWNFASMKVDCDPVPWDYEDVVREYLWSDCRVLDIGTGGGEVFLRLAPLFREGIGIDADPEMIRVAGENSPVSMCDRVSFLTMPAEALRFPDASFDVILNRQAPFVLAEIARVLRPGGIFVSQQVGDHNTQNIFEALGWESNGTYIQALHVELEEPPPISLESAAAEFASSGCTIVRQESYDVPYYFQDLASLVFWLRAAPIPMNFDDDRHVQAIATYIAENWTPRGIRTNEHRELLVVAKHHQA